jgi:GNAT superfamily N-acetyltransferase
MTDDVIIRQATLDDVEQIVTHRRRMFEDMGNKDPAALDRMAAAFRPWLTQHMQQSLYMSWLAGLPDGGMVAGCDVWLMDWPPGQYDVSAYRGYILNVYTRPDYRRRGLAKRLLQTCMDWCYSNGVHIISLHASPDGRTVYEQLGFTPTNEMNTWKGRS